MASDVEKLVFELDERLGAADRLGYKYDIGVDLGFLRQLREALTQPAASGEVAQPDADTMRLDYIERTFSGCTNRERYLPVHMIWGKGCNGRSLREACDKYMARDAAIDSAIKGEK